MHGSSIFVALVAFASAAVAAPQPAVRVEELVCDPIWGDRCDRNYASCVKGGGDTAACTCSTANSFNGAGAVYPVCDFEYSILKHQYANTPPAVP